MRPLAIALAVFCSIAVAAAQDRTPNQFDASTPATEFEAVSVKRVTEDTRPFSFASSTTGFRTTGLLPLLLVQAFPGRSEWQVSGIPDWARSEFYEVIATYKPGAPAPTPTERSAMLRRMFADRFKLQTHEESRELPVYNLVIAREDKRLGKGLQGPLKEDCDAILAAEAEQARATGQAPQRPRPGVPLPPCSNRFQIPHLEGAVTMNVLATIVQGLLRQPVKNATGLTGYYRIDFTAGFELGPTPSPVTPDAPSLFTALPEQLGLKLERGRALFQVLVIDHIERPTEN